MFEFVCSQIRSRIGIEERQDKTGQGALARKSGIHGKSTCVHTCSVRTLLVLFYSYLCCFVCALYLGEAKLYVRSCMFTDPVEDRNRRMLAIGRWPEERAEYTERAHVYTPVLCCLVCSCVLLRVLALYLGSLKLYVRSRSQTALYLGWLETRLIRTEHYFINLVDDLAVLLGH